MVEVDHDVDAALAAAAERGFDFVEVNAEGAGHAARDPADVREAAASAGVDLVVHLPYHLDVGSPHEHVRDGACRQLEAAIDAALGMGVDRGVFHATTFANDRWDRGRVYAAVAESVERVHDYGRERGFDACAENLKGEFVDAGDFPDLLERTGGLACLDTGHAHATGHGVEWQADFLREHGDRVAHVHLNDTRRDDTDEHLPVGVGKLDFAPLVEAMVDTGWAGTCTHEVFTPDADHGAVGYGKGRFDELLADAR